MKIAHHISSLKIVHRFSSLKIAYRLSSLLKITFWFLLISMVICPQIHAENIAQTHLSHAQMKQIKSNLRSGHWQAKWRSLLLLGQVPTRQLELLPELIKCLSDVNLMVKAQAILLIGSIGAPAKKAIPLLAKALASSNGNVGMQAGLTLGKMGNVAWKTIKKASEHPSPKVKIRITLALPSFGKKALTLLLKMYPKGSKKLQMYCLQAIWKLARQIDTTPALPLLIKAARSQDHLIRYWSLNTLMRMGPKAKQAIPMLRQQLKHKEPTIRRRALLALNQMGAHARSSLALALQLAQKDPDISVRCAALRAIGGFQIVNRQVLTQLTKALAQHSLSKRRQGTCQLWNAISSLGRLGPPAKSAIPALLKKFAQSTHSIRYTIIIALGKIHSSPQQVLPVLQLSLSDRRLNIRRAALDALNSFGKLAEPAVPALTKIFLQPIEQTKELNRTKQESRNYELAILRQKAAAILEKMGVSAIPAYKKGLQHKELRIRIQSIEKLGQMRHYAAPAYRELIAALKDPQLVIRYRAAEILGYLPKYKKESKAELIQALLDPHHWVRYYALRSLGSFGGQDALKQAIKHQKDKSSFVRQLANQLVKKLSPPTSRPSPTSQTNH